MVIIDFMPWLEDVRLRLSLSEMRTCHECLIVVCLWFAEGILQSFTFNFFGGYLKKGSKKSRVKADHFFLRAALLEFFAEEFVQGFSDFQFWSDTGPGHFLTQRSLAFMLEFLPRQFPFIKDIVWNFFAEQHGKCRADLAGSHAKRAVKLVALDGKPVIGVTGIVSTLNEVADWQKATLLAPPDRTNEHGVTGLTHMRRAGAHHQFWLKKGERPGKQDEYVLQSRFMSDVGDCTDQIFRYLPEADNNGAV